MASLFGKKPAVDEQTTQTPKQERRLAPVRVKQPAEGRHEDLRLYLKDAKKYGVRRMPETVDRLHKNREPRNSTPPEEGCHICRGQADGQEPHSSNNEIGAEIVLLDVNLKQAKHGASNRVELLLSPKQRPPR
uniref:Uncharacterized protein n=1 Tax=Parascaris univalens TaxID=6257 RepID=A0A915BM94_PARUN